MFHYRYPQDDGSNVEFTFVADKQGYQPKSDILPPLPAFVLRQIEKARQEQDDDDEPSLSYTAPKRVKVQRTYSAPKTVKVPRTYKPARKPSSEESDESVSSGSAYAWALGASKPATQAPRRSSYTTKAPRRYTPRPTTRRYIPRYTTPKPVEKESSEETDSSVYFIPKVSAPEIETDDASEEEVVAVIEDVVDEEEVSDEEEDISTNVFMQASKTNGVVDTPDASEEEVEVETEAPAEVPELDDLASDDDEEILEDAVATESPEASADEESDEAVQELSTNVFMQASRANGVVDTPDAADDDFEAETEASIEVPELEDLLSDDDDDEVLVELVATETPVISVDVEESDETVQELATNVFMQASKANGVVDTPDAADDDSATIPAVAPELGELIDKCSFVLCSLICFLSTLLFIPL